MTSLSSANIDFQSATRVAATTGQYVIPVPKMPNEHLAIPIDPASVTEKEDGARGGSHGMVVPLTWRSNDVSEAATASPVPCDGRGAVVIHDVSEAQAKQIDDFVKANIGRFTSASKIQSAVDFAQSELGLAQVHIASADDVRLKASHFDGSPIEKLSAGYFRATSEAIALAVVAGESGVLLDQSGNSHRFESGAVLLKEMSADAQATVRVLDSSDFQKHFALANGSTISLETIPEMDALGSIRTRPIAGPTEHLGDASAPIQAGDSSPTTSGNGPSLSENDIRSVEHDQMASAGPRPAIAAVQLFDEAAVLAHAADRRPSIDFLDSEKSKSTGEGAIDLKLRDFNPF